METNVSSKIQSKTYQEEAEHEKSADVVEAEPLNPPVFGITFIGTSHGFDATGAP